MYACIQLAVEITRHTKLKTLLYKKNIIFISRTFLLVVRVAHHNSVSSSEGERGHSTDNGGVVL